jgi:hypothetical protein
LVVTDFSQEVRPEKKKNTSQGQQMKATFFLFVVVLQLVAGLAPKDLAGTPAGLFQHSSFIRM